MAAVLEEWDRAAEKHKQTLEIVAKVAKTDHTLWFKRTGWPEHLAGCNMRHLSRATRMPDRDETVLRRTVELIDVLVERAVGGLSTLDHETRRWLRSAKQAEIDVRPLGRLQNLDSQVRYVGYTKRCLCYVSRVYGNVESVAAQYQNEGSAHAGVEDDGSEVDDESGDESDDLSNANAETDEDIFCDARKLSPWRNGLEAHVRDLWQAVKSSYEGETQLERLSAVFQVLIVQHVRGDTVKSALIHFSPFLESTRTRARLREADDFSYMLAGVVYRVRVLAAEILLPSVEREQQGDDNDKRFQRLREECLADGSYIVMSKMLSLLLYGKSLALNHGNSGAVFWSKDGKTMSYRGMPIVIAQFKKMVLDVMSDAEDMLWRDLIGRRTPNDLRSRSTNWRTT